MGQPSQRKLHTANSWSSALQDDSANEPDIIRPVEAKACREDRELIDPRSLTSRILLRMSQDKFNDQ